MEKSAKKEFNVASELLDQNALVRGSKVAITCKDEKVTYKELQENVNRFANVLKSLGVKPTERVMILLPGFSGILLCLSGEHQIRRVGSPGQHHAQRERLRIYARKQRSKGACHDGGKQGRKDPHKPPLL